MISLCHIESEWTEQLTHDGDAVLVLLRTMLFANHRRPPLDAESESLLDHAESAKADPLDTVCLCLSLLTTLLQSSDAAKDFIREAGEPDMTVKLCHADSNKIKQ
jgi:hypothetical protein